MSGSYYIAVTGMRTRLDQLDRVASDIANVSTAGYKAERATTAEADRPTFGNTLQSAIDVANGPVRVDLRSGAITPSSRPLDLAVDGQGFFEIDTPSGPRYTRDGRFVRGADSVLATSDGHPVVGTKGTIKLASDDITVDPDGTVRSSGAVAGTIKLVDFETPQDLVKEAADRFMADPATAKAASGTIRSGAVEQANVSVVDRVAELTTVMRGFEALQRAVSVLANDVDGRAISELGRH